MASTHIRAAALLLAALALTATPSFAQRNGGGRRDGGGDGRRDGGERAQPRSREAPNVDRQRDGSAGRQRDGNFDRQRDGGFDRQRDNRQRSVQPYRGYGNVQPYRGYGSRPYVYRPYNNYRSYGYRSYVAPFGYRPYGYRQGWSLNLYFGRPYYGYGYPAYGYPSSGYGYYSLAPGRLYGSVRIVDAPRDARVLVDGYYAGIVDDYDGVFQHLNLEAGAHRIEIEEDGYAPLEFDVRVEPGQTITLRADVR